MAPLSENYMPLIDEEALGRGGVLQLAAVKVIPLVDDKLAGLHVKGSDGGIRALRFLKANFYEVRNRLVNT